MTIAAETYADYLDAFSETGETVYLRRFAGTGTPRPKTDTALVARVMGYEPSELVGPIVQGDRKLIVLANAALTGVLPVTTIDKIVIRGKEVAIKAVDDNTRRVAGTLIALEIQVGG